MKTVGTLLVVASLTGCATNQLERAQLNAADYRHFDHLAQPYKNCMAWNGQYASENNVPRGDLERSIPDLCQGQLASVTHYIGSAGALYAAADYEDHLLSQGAEIAIDEYLKAGLYAPHPADVPLVAAWPTYTIDEVVKYARFESKNKDKSEIEVFSVGSQPGEWVDDPEDFARMTQPDTRDELPAAIPIDVDAPPVVSVATSEKLNAVSEELPPLRLVGPRTKPRVMSQAADVTECSC